MSYTFELKTMKTLTAPKGFEFTGEMRNPQDGEWFYATCGTYTHQETLSRGEYGGDYPILCKKWIAPAWLPEGAWLWRNDAGSWRLSRNIPEDRKNPITGVSVFVSELAHVARKIFTPPEHTTCIQVQHETK